MKMFSTLLTLCERNSPVNHGFPLQRASNVEKVIMPLCHHDKMSQEWEYYWKYVHFFQEILYLIATQKYCYCFVNVIFGCNFVFLLQSAPFHVQVIHIIELLSKSMRIRMFCFKKSVPFTLATSGSIGWGNGLLTDGTKPLPEPINE